MFKAALVTGLTLCAATANARTIPAPDLVNGWQHDSNQLSESKTVSFTVYAKEQRLDKLKYVLFYVGRELFLLLRVFQELVENK